LITKAKKILLLFRLKVLIGAYKLLSGL